VLLGYSIDAKVPGVSVLDKEVDGETTEEEEKGDEPDQVEEHDHVHLLLHLGLLESALALV